MLISLGPILISVLIAWGYLEGPLLPIHPLLGLLDASSWLLTSTFPYRH